MPAAVNLRGDLIRDIAAHEARRCPSGRTPCARTSTACRCRARARRSASCRAPARRRREQRARVMHDARDCANIGQRAEFVVHEHQRHEARIGADGGSDRVGGDLAVARGREERDRRAVLRQVRHRVENGLVLDAARDQVALAGRVFRIALQREVVRFGGARRPDDLVGVRADQRGDLRAGLLDLVFREPAGGIGSMPGCRRCRRSRGRPSSLRSRADRRASWRRSRGSAAGGVAHVLLMLVSFGMEEMIRGQKEKGSKVGWRFSLIWNNVLSEVGFGEFIFMTASGCDLRVRGPFCEGWSRCSMN